MDELDLFLQAEDAPGTTDDMELATVVGVGSNGVTLLIDGNEEAGAKEYRVNIGQIIKPGDRVKISRISGSYVVDYVVGSPMAGYAIPPGGTDGQVLTKDGTSDYSVKWADAGGGAASELVKDNYKLILNSSGVLAAENSSRKITLGTQTVPFNGCYLGGEIRLGTSTSDKIGFFGHAVAARQSVSSTATVGTLITALKAYGLIV